MRATADTIAHLTLCKEELEAQHTKEKLKTYRATVTYSHIQFHSFVWAMFWTLQKADKDAIIANQGNPLQNHHLETALKHVWKDYNQC